MVETILSSPIFVEVILPFLLVFVVTFAILQKSHIFGEGKRQIDAIVALVVGLILVSFGYATGIIVSLVPFLAVSAIIILVFMLLYGMVHKEGAFDLPPGLRTGFGVLIGIALTVAVLVVTGAWDAMIEAVFYTEGGSAIFTNVVFGVIIIAAIAIVMLSGREKKKKDD